MNRRKFIKALIGLGVAALWPFKAKSLPEPAYIAIVNPDLRAELKNLPGWVPVSGYSAENKEMPGEIGSFHSIRFV